MVAQVVLDESCDEKIAVVVTLLHAQLQGIVTGYTGLFQGAGFQLVDQVFIAGSLVDQQGQFSELTPVMNNLQRLSKCCEK